MKKTILFLSLISFSLSFAQQKEKKKKIRRPVEFVVSFDAQFFYQGWERLEDSNETLNYTYIKSPGYEKPMYSINISANKPLTNHFLVGLEAGVSRTRDIRDLGEAVYFYFVPTSLNLTYNFWKNKKTLLRPFVVLQGGYVFMHDNTYRDVEIDGGLSYGMKVGLSINNKNSKLLDNLRLTLGYRNFFTNIYTKYRYPPLAGAYTDYKVRREGFTMGLQYKFPTKKKRRKKKRRKKH